MGVGVGVRMGMVRVAYVCRVMRLVWYGMGCGDFDRLN